AAPTGIESSPMTAAPDLTVAAAAPDLTAIETALGQTSGTMSLVERFDDAGKSIGHAAKTATGTLYAVNVATNANTGAGEVTLAAEQVSYIDENGAAQTAYAELGGLSGQTAVVTVG